MNKVEDLRLASDREKKRQDELYPDNIFSTWNDNWTRYVIVAEEFGEMAKAIVDGNDEELLKELIQVHALLERWFVEGGINAKIEELR